MDWRRRGGFGDKGFVLFVGTGEIRCHRGRRKARYCVGGASGSDAGGDDSGFRVAGEPVGTHPRVARSAARRAAPRRATDKRLLVGRELYLHGPNATSLPANGDTTSSPPSS